MAKKTLVQLIEENTTLQNRVKYYEDRDEKTRRGIAKEFGWYKKRTQYSYGEEEPALPSWYEIFTELGKLLHAQKQLYYVTDVEELKMNVRELQIRAEEQRLKDS